MIKNKVKRQSKYICLSDGKSIDGTLEKNQLKAVNANEFYALDGIDYLFPSVRLEQAKRLILENYQTFLEDIYEWSIGRDNGQTYVHYINRRLFFDPRISIADVADAIMYFLEGIVNVRLSLKPTYSDGFEYPDFIDIETNKAITSADCTYHLLARGMQF
jgi:hypothetical protein